MYWNTYRLLRLRQTSVGTKHWHTIRGVVLILCHRHRLWCVQLDSLSISDKKLVYQVFWELPGHHSLWSTLTTFQNYPVNILVCMCEYLHVVIATSNEVLASLISKFHTGRRKPRQAFQFRSLKKQQSQQVNSTQYSNNPLTSPVKSLLKIPSNSPMRRTSVSEGVGKQPSVPQLLTKPVIQTSGTFVPPLPPGTTASTKSVPNKRQLEVSQNGERTYKHCLVIMSCD